MKSVEIIRSWFSVLTKPDKTVKLLEKKKLKAVDGFKSIALLSLIASLIACFLMLLVAGFASFTEIVKEAVLMFIGISLFGIVVLSVFSYLFVKIMKRHKGKAKFDKITGVYGLFAGMMAVAMIPYAAGYILMRVFMTIPLLAYFLMGAGVVVSTAYSGRILGVLIEAVSGIEKVKVNEMMWVQNLVIGLGYFTLLVVTGVLVSLS